MPRNSGGVYSLPAGNPVVTGEVISSAWANTTLTDIATAMTASLSRSGEGGMLAALQLFSGAIGAPGLTWSSETTSGLYRNAAGDFRWAIGGVDIFQFTSAIFQINTRTILSNTDVELNFIETDGAANNKAWSWLIQGEQFKGVVLNDARSSIVNWLTVDRTGVVVDSIGLIATNINLTGILNLTGAANLTGLVTVTGNLQPNNSVRNLGDVTNRWATVYGQAFSDGANGGYLSSSGTTAILTGGTDWAVTSFRTAGTERLSMAAAATNFLNTVLQYGGLEVGYRDANVIGLSGTTSLSNTHGGKICLFFGAAAQTITFDANSMTGNRITTIINSSNAVTISSGAGTFQWYNGSGALVSGNRTLAVGGVMTLVANGSIAYLWGTGIT